MYRLHFKPFTLLILTRPLLPVTRSQFSNFVSYILIAFCTIKKFIDFFNSETKQTTPFLFQIIQNVSIELIFTKRIVSIESIQLQNHQISINKPVENQSYVQHRRI
jgi:hypothetical protein